MPDPAAGSDRRRPRTGVGRGSWLARGVIVAGQSTQAVGVAAIALFMPIICADLGLSFGQAGLLAAVTTLTYALMQMPAGLAAQRWGARRIFSLGLLGTNILGLVFALSSAFPMLLAVQAVAGLCRGLMFVPGLILITEQFAESMRAAAMGLLFAGGLSAYVTVNLLGPLLVGHLGWRGFLLMMSGAGLLLLLIFVGLSPRGARTSDERMAGRRATGLWMRPDWWILGGVQFVRMAVMVGFTFWLPTFLITEHRVSLSGTGLVVALTYATAALFNLVGGVASDRWDLGMAVIPGSLLGLSLVLLSIGFMESLPLVLVATGLVAILVQLYFGPLFLLPRLLFGQSAAGISTGFGNFCASLGGFTASLSLGLVHDLTGSFTAGFVGMGVLAFVAALLSGWLRLLIRAERRSPLDLRAGR